VATSSRSKGRKWRRCVVHIAPIDCVELSDLDGRQNGDGELKFRRGHPLRGAKYRWGIKIARFSTNKSLYLANDPRCRHGCYGKRIGTHTRSIKWCHFQWSWMNPNPIFKVRPFFDAEHLQNGYRYIHSYYGRRIGNCTKLLNGISFNDLQRPLILA